MRKRRREHESEEIYFGCIRLIRRVYNIQRRVVQFAEDISYPKTKKGRAMTWLQLIMNLIAIGEYHGCRIISYILSNSIIIYAQV